MTTPESAKERLAQRLHTAPKKHFFTSPQGMTAQAQGTGWQTLPGRRFLLPYKVQVHYRGTLCGLVLGAGCGLCISFMFFKNCRYNVPIDAHARAFRPFLQGFFANLSAFFPLQG